MRIVAGRWGGRTIATPPGRDTRPTAERVREALMSVLAAELPGARVLDLFAGSGALGLEALSRGAEQATFVESAERASRVLRGNIAALGASENARVVNSDALRFLNGIEALEFDLAFADPPYDRQPAGRVDRTDPAFLSDRPLRRDEPSLHAPAADGDRGREDQRQRYDREGHRGSAA